jgi:hypothetical protein
MLKKLKPRLAFLLAVIPCRFRSMDKQYQRIRVLFILPGDRAHLHMAIGPDKELRRVPE